MTFLPILQRELRVRARSRANYWSRAGVALVALLITTPPLLWSAPFRATGVRGHDAFVAVTSAAFLLCCAACLLTADAISGERRQGTLGLLFLTRVRVLDVLVGKLAANGLTCLLALAAFTPVLMLPVLAGGVTGAEVVRKALVLVAVLFLALSTGLCASAEPVDRARSARASLGLLAGLIFGPSLCGLLIASWLKLLGPLATMSLAGDVAYRASARQYWVSIALVLASGVIMFLRAEVLLRKRLPDEVDPTPATVPASASAGTSQRLSSNREEIEAAQRVIWSCTYCGHKNVSDDLRCVECGSTRFRVEPAAIVSPKLGTQPSPMHWLLRRRRGIQPLFWLAAFVGFIHYAIFGIIGRAFTLGYFFTMTWGLGFVSTALGAALIAWAASRFFVEARQSGELEWLMTTPVGAESVASAQWDELKRMLRGPVLVMLIPSILQGLFGLAFLNPFRHEQFASLVYFVLIVLGAVNIVVGIEALCRTALWFGWGASTQTRAVLWSVALTKVPPYLLAMTGSIVVRSISGRPFSVSLLIGSLLPQVGVLLFYLWLSRVARHQLAAELSGAEPVRLGVVLAGRISGVIRRLRTWPSA